MRPPFPGPPAALLKTMGEQGKWQLAEKFFRELEAEQLELMAKEAAASGARQPGGAALPAPAAEAEPAPTPVPVAAFPGMAQHLDLADAPGANPEAIAAAAAAVAALAAHQQALVAAAGGAAVPLDLALLQQLAAQAAAPVVPALDEEDTEADESLVGVASAAAEAVLATPRGGSPTGQLAWAPADMRQQEAPQQQHGSFFSYFSGASSFKSASSGADKQQQLWGQAGSAESPSSVADAGAAASGRRSPFALDQQTAAGPLGAAWTSDNAASRGLSLHLAELTAAAPSEGAAAAAPAAAQPKLKPLPKGRGPVNEVVCGALMLAYERAGKWQEAVGVLERARTLGEAPLPAGCLPCETCRRG